MNDHSVRKRRDNLLSTDNNLSVFTISQAAIKRCPHFILVPDHYRYDNTCRCDDPTHIEMIGYGYIWNETKSKWDSKNE